MNKATKLPNKKATPIKRMIVDKYIGFRLKPNGPSTTSVIDILNSFPVVFFFINWVFAWLFITKPKINNGMPIRIYGKGIILFIGKKKCEIKAMIRYKIKISGRWGRWMWITFDLETFYSINSPQMKSGRIVKRNLYNFNFLKFYHFFIKFLEY